MNLLLAQNNAAATPAESPLARDAADRLSELRDQTLDFLQANGIALVINLLVAGVIFLVGRFAARMLTGVVQRGLQRARVDPMLVSFLVNIVYALLLVVVVMGALSQLGVETTSLAAVLAAAGFAVGMALQGSLGNLASGVMLIVFRPFKSGDFVEAAGTKGIVEEIEIFNTILRTPDNVRVIVPNGQITGSVIINYAARETRRIDLVIGCSYSDDIRAVKAFLNQIIAEQPRILADPAPVVAVDELADSSIKFVVRPWVRTGDYGDVKWDLIERIKLGFDERGFNFPFPSRDVYVHQREAA